MKDIVILKYDISLNELKKRIKAVDEMRRNRYYVIEIGKHCWEVYAPSGKVYTVKYRTGKMTCNCPDAIFRARKVSNGWCKHILFVLKRVELDEELENFISTNPYLSLFFDFEI